MLSECLLVANAEGNTPLHSCCYMMVNEMPRVDYYLDCFSGMVDLVHRRNSTGGTATKNTCQIYIYMAK